VNNTIGSFSVTNQTAVYMHMEQRDLQKEMQGVLPSLKTQAPYVAVSKFVKLTTENDKIEHIAGVLKLTLKATN